MWKYTNIIDGSIITDKKDRIDGVTVSQGPKKLVLLHVDKKRVSEIENEMQKFAKNIKLIWTTMQRSAAITVRQLRSQI